jgi:uncharacterized protein (TIGR00299 family) protein
LSVCKRRNGDGHAICADDHARRPAVKHIHLDPLGGVAGDMFIAAMLDAFPTLTAGAIQAAGALAPVSCTLDPHKDHILAGSHFQVSAKHPPGHHAHGSHDHTHWADIREMIRGSALAAPVKAHALGIFGVLAQAEAKVHGIDPEHVTFHEVGAADSVADIVAASWLIDAIGQASWSVSPIPLGSGTVMTAHGKLPVPAPATALLLAGLPICDDGIAGERVTPTGAAILRHLGCGPKPGGLRMGPTGIGFGTRILPGISNCLRVLVFERAEEGARSASAMPHRNLLVVSFEVDDQSPEDLATGLDRLRARADVHDVLTMPAFGKKNRMAMHVQVLASAEEAVVAACFTQTTTIGLRTQIVSARALPRRVASIATADGPVRVKLVERPGGTTAKAELDDLAPVETHAARARLRRAAEEAAC